MTEHRSERPQRLVTLCAYLGLIGAFQAVSAVSVLVTWYSKSGGEQVKDFTDPLVKDGLDRGDAELVFRVYLGILAALGAAVVVFAVYTALGHAVSRVMVTIVAPLMGLAGMSEGSILSVLLSVVVFTCVFQLWTPDVRRWFAVLAGSQPPAAAATAWPPAAQPQPPATTQHPRAYAPPPAAVGQQRPRARTDWVTILSIVTIVGASVVALGCAYYLVMYEVARDELVRRQLRSDFNWMHLTEAEIREAYHQLAIVSWAAIPLCVVAIIVSVVLLVRRRHRA
jgi:hypothetical protein